MLKSLLNKVSGGKKKDDKKGANKVRTTPKQIAGLLQKAFLSNELLEIRVDDQAHYQTSYLIDFPTTFESLIADYDEPTEAQIENCKQVVANYKAGEYLNNREFLVITKPNKKKDAAAIKPESVLVTRFFLGANRHTFQTCLADKVTIDGQEFYVLEFPDDLVTQPGRQFHRAKPNTAYKGIVNIICDEGQTYTSNVKDLSAGGMSFTLPDDMPDLDLNSDLEVSLIFSEKPPLTVMTNVRSLTTISRFNPEDKTIGSARLAGLQFHLKSRATASAIEAEVVVLQREELQRNKNALM